MQSPTRRRNPWTNPQLSFEELDGLLGYRMRRAQGAMHRDYLAAVVGLNLTQKQTATLWLINGNPGVSQVQIAAALGMDRATMMALVDRLEGRGLRACASGRRRSSTPGALTNGGGPEHVTQGQDANHRARRIASRALFEPAELEGLLAALKKFQALA